MGKITLCMAAVLVVFNHSLHIFPSEKALFDYGLSVTNMRWDEQVTKPAQRVNDDKYIKWTAEYGSV